MKTEKSFLSHKCCVFAPQNKQQSQKKSPPQIGPNIATVKGLQETKRGAALLIYAGDLYR